MASNYFTISPTGGTGNGTVAVSVTGNNMTINDRVAIVSINGHNVTVTQYGMPHITGQSFPISAPATGGSYSFTVHTHYDVQFRDKPDWITIDDGQGNYISSATTIQASVANGKTYNLTVAPNATNNSRTETFGMYHYMYNNLMPDYVSMGITQPQGAEDYITIISTSALDWDDTNAKVISVNANVNWSASIDNTADFELAGGQGYVTIRAKDTNSGTTLKTTTISIASNKSSFPYTATCVVTQYRRPIISVVGGSSVPNTGGTMYVEVKSDYYWWLSPTVSPDTNAYYNYISMSAKTADTNMSPVPTTHTYSLDFTANNDVTTRNVGLYVGYLKLDNSTTGRSSQSASFTQPNIIADTFVVTPTTIPQSGYASSGGGVYTLEVTTNRTWGLSQISTICEVVPNSGTGSTSVTITIPPSSVSGSSYHLVESLLFMTKDGGIVASQSVPVLQYDNYQEPAYIVVDTEYMEVPSGANSYSFGVSANTNWSAVMEEWIHMNPATGGTGNTSHYFSVDENSGATRDGSIDFVPLGAGTSIAFLSVRQASGITPVVVDSISVNPSSKSIGSGSSLYNEVYVTASTTWSLSKPSWIRWIDSSTFTDTTSGTAGTKKLYMNADANTGSSRTGTTTFTCGTASTTYTVTQAEAYEEPVGYLELDPAQISPASSSYQVYEVEVYNPTPHNYMIVYGGDWVKFYDGPYPSTADEVNVIESEERLNIYLEVQAGHHGTTTILFVNEDDPDDYITFVVNQQ